MKLQKICGLCNILIRLEGHVTISDPLMQVSGVSMRAGTDATGVHVSPARATPIHYSTTALATD